MPGIFSLVREAKMVLRAAIDLVATRLRIPFEPAARVPERNWLARIIGLSVETLHASDRADLGADDVVLLSVIRDAGETLEEFIEHHLKLGIRHIILLDNGTSDGSTSIVPAYDNVTLLRSRMPFRTYARVFRLYLKMRFGRDRWSLSIDADELFVYPCSDRVSLPELVRYLEEHEFNAVLANQLELFANAPLSQTSAGDGRSLKEIYRHYDATEVVTREVFAASGREPLVEVRSGGIRASYFGWTRGHLSKYPLVRQGSGLRLRDSRNHRVGPSARLADISCVLLHYQFTATLHERSRIAVERANYGHGSARYQHFLRVLAENPDVNLFEEATSPKELSSADRLEEDGYMMVGPGYREYADVRDSFELDDIERFE